MRASPAGSKRCAGGAFAVALSLVLAALPRGAIAEVSPIAAAARAGDLAKVRTLIDARADVNLRAADGATALLWAAYHADLDMAAALLDAGANPNAANDYGVTPLLQASRTGDAPLVAALLAGGADARLAHPEGETPLMGAARAGNLDTVRALLARGADPNAAETFQRQTALMWASAEGHLAVVDALLAAGADPNAQSRTSALTVRKNADFPSGGFTALMWAVRNGHEAVVRRLLERGADPDLRNGDGATALMLAVVNDRFDLAAALVELGADPNDGSLYYAVEMRDATTDWYAHDGSKLRNDFPNERTALDLVALLLDRGADPNKPFVGQMHSSAMCCDTFANATPFFRAAIAADVEALKLLIAHGADLEWRPTNVDGGPAGANTYVGRTAIVVAINGGRGVPLSAGPGYNRVGAPPFREPSLREPAAAIRLLADAGANVNAVGPDGATALHKAVELRNLDTLRALTDSGADLRAKNADGLTALDLAARLEPRSPNPFGPQTADAAAPQQVVRLLRDALQRRPRSAQPRAVAAQ